MTDARTPSDAILTVPNLLSFFRLGLTPIFLWVALVPDNIGAAFALAFMAFVTDLADGKIARRFGQISKLGIQLDPLSDRLGLAAGAAVLIVHDLAPLWVILLVLARDVALLVVGAPLLKARGIPIPPVSRIGKYGSFGVSLGFGVLLLSGVTSVEAPITWVRAVGLSSLAIGIPLYYAAAFGYVRVGLSSLKDEK